MRPIIIRLKVILLVALTALATGWITSGRGAAAGVTIRLTPAQAERLFAEKIRPVLESKCQACHSAENAQSGLDLGARGALLKGGKRGAAMVPGDAAQSLLFIAITGADETRIKRMPPGGKPLDENVIAAFKQWIDAGAPWPETKAERAQTYQDSDVWAFKKMRAIDPPVFTGSPVDAFLQQKLDERKLTPAPAADRVALLRRATFDLHGLPPTPEEVADFVNDGDRSKPAAPVETFILIGGNLTSLGEKASPAVPMAPCRYAEESAPALPAKAAGRRLALAQWMARAEHPLTARVMVNRLWQWHFGKGLVETANNFGKLGKRPTHPELLDWLAREFAARGWSIKTMHRLLMNTDAYRRAAAHPQLEAVKKADPENHLLAVFPARRLEAEELRDALLLVSGELNLTAGGPPVFPEINADLMTQPRLIMGTVAPAWEASPARAARNRRTIYTFQQRSLVNPLVEVFNGASLNESCEFRRASTVAPRVFNLFNSQFSHDAALAFAARLEREAPTLDRQITLAFRLALQRAPSAAELQLSRRHVAAMTGRHERIAPPSIPALKPVELFINSEFTGQTIRFVEDTDFTGYERNLHSSQVKPATRALAELCLTLLNANEFVYVY